jgi:hypothetical protein
MSIFSIISHAVALGLGILLGAFALRRNPIVGAKTLDELEKVYHDTKLKMVSKLRK